MAKLTMTLGQMVRPEFLHGFRKLRAVGLPCAYDVALVAGTVDRHVRAWEEARLAHVKRLGAAFEVGTQGEAGHQSGWRVKDENLPEFERVMSELERQAVELPIERKLKLGPMTGQFSADDLIPLLEIIEP